MGTKFLTKATALNATGRFSVESVELRFATPTYRIGVAAPEDAVSPKAVRQKHIRRNVDILG